jgi:hypothetical protein
VAFKELKIWRCAHPHAISSIQKNSPNLWVSNIAALLSSTWSTSFSAVPMQTYKQLHCTCPASAFKRSWTQWTSMDFKFMSFNPEAKKTSCVRCDFPGSPGAVSRKAFLPEPQLSTHLLELVHTFRRAQKMHARCTKGLKSIGNPKEGRMAKPFGRVARSSSNHENMISTSVMKTMMVSFYSFQSCSFWWC